MNADRRRDAAAGDLGRVEFAPAEGAAAGAYPTVRMRRNRRDAWTRRLVAENEHLLPRVRGSERRRLAEAEAASLKAAGKARTVASEVRRQVLRADGGVEEVSEVFTSTVGGEEDDDDDEFGEEGFSDREADDMEMD